ncbi:hypothetical protein TELCIR_08708 [Teladorsagia circumcincta]|uniref:Carboxylesterase type B domain-containing protein n=1 Tax=Teladorsagia circumcincta TaxID=45464 RepID=A0A2G9UGT0_TELCI|nr:hypothetical protein TELCIR_08708 [Teladorsagia circumcincta]
MKACPVAFYIHGGGFNYDSAVMFKDDALINNFGGNGDFRNFEDQELLYIVTRELPPILLFSGIVLVIPGVRLGFFGLLTFASDNIVPRNLAAYGRVLQLLLCNQGSHSTLTDLLAALEFVQKEIHYFGGDANNVTMIGHSSGACAAAQFAFSKQIDSHSKFVLPALRNLTFYSEIIYSLSLAMELQIA